MFIITIWLTVTKYPFCVDDFLFFLYRRIHLPDLTMSNKWLSCRKREQLTFPSGLVESLLLIFFLYCGVFILILFVFVLCLLPIVVLVSGLSIFNSPCQRQGELLPSLGVRRLLTFHILIFSSETRQMN